MDDTVAMQDSANRVALDGQTGEGLGAACKADGPGSRVGDQLTAALLGRPPPLNESQPSTPQQQHPGGDGCSVASDGSQDQQPRQMLRFGPAVDVDAAKQAAMSALAGLDMTTTKANLDASKAAAATARANGEIPTHARKSNLRSVSCRQLGSGAPAAGKTVMFDDTAKSKPAADSAARPAPGTWRGGTSDPSQPRRTPRTLASRCISLPHVLAGRAGMANRLTATYAQDAALQQQLQLLNGGAGQPLAAAYAPLQPAGMAQLADPLSVYQLQQVGGAPAAALLGQQRPFAAAGMSSLDDSVLQLRSGALVMSQQPQPLQQQARLAPPTAGWAGAGGAPAVGGGPVRWDSVPMAQVAAAAAPNAQLLAQQQPAGGEALWMTAPAASAALQLSAARPQGLVLASQVSSGMAPVGIPGLQQQALLPPSLQPGGSAQPSLLPDGGASPVALLESYRSVSWSVLSAAQSEVALRDQLLTELVLLLSMLTTLGHVLKGAPSAADALTQLSFLSSAARRHMATFARLSQAGNIGVELLAHITPMACKHLGSQGVDVLEAAFLVLDALSLANSDVAMVVAQQRIQALSTMMAPVSVDQLLQQQTLCLQLINGLTSAVNGNKGYLESITGGDVLAASSQPMLLAPAGGGPGALPGGALSPGRKTPLATYFEEAGVAHGGGAGADQAAAAVAGGPGSAAPSPTAVGSTLLVGPFTGVAPLAAPPGIGDDGVTSPQLGLVGLQKMASLSMGIAPGPMPPAAGAPGATQVAGVANGTFSPLNGGMSLFGDVGLVASSGPSSAGATSLVGVQ